MSAPTTVAPAGGRRKRRPDKRIVVTTKYRKPIDVDLIATALLLLIEENRADINCLQAELDARK